LGIGILQKHQPGSLLAANLDVVSSKTSVKKQTQAYPGETRQQQCSVCNVKTRLMLVPEATAPAAAAAAAAGLWTLQNFARPLRISLALALAPAFDKAITRIGEKLHIDKKWAFGIFLLCMGVVTSVTLFGTIYLLGGFPS
jgi:hypothetical protein